MATITRRRNAKQVSGESIVIEAAWTYYHDGLNQAEITKRQWFLAATSLPKTYMSVLACKRPL